jgi:hypothetical protein
MSQIWALTVPAVIGILFLLLGIHNAWDTLTYLVVYRPESLPDRRAGNE